MKEVEVKQGGVGQATFGLLLMVAGGLLLLSQMHVVQLRPFYHYWPILLLVLGTVKIIAPRWERDILGGADLLMFGLWGLACQNHWGGLTWSNSIPLILVAMGIRMVLGAFLGKRGDKQSRHEETHHA